MQTVTDHNLVGASFSSPMRQQATAMVAPIHPIQPHDSEHLPLRILVLSDMIGAIIGRSGSTIKQITHEAKVRVDVHREDCLDQLEKVITINGPPDNCSQACFRILKIIENEKLNMDMKHPSTNSNGSQEDNSASAELDNSLEQRLLTKEIHLRILAHNNLIGRFIGKNGSSIRKIMEQTSTKINISTNSLTEYTRERTINVVGTFNNVCHAQQVIFSKLKAAYLSDINFTMQALNSQTYPYSNVPISFMPRPYTQNTILSSLVSSHSQASHPSYGKPRGFNGSHRANQIATPSMYHNSATTYLPLYPNISHQAGHGFMDFSQLMTGHDAEKETVIMYIPTNVVGAIIGKSGSAIKEMISASGASIKIAAAAPNLSSEPSHQKAQSETDQRSDEKPTQDSKDDAAAHSSQEPSKETNQEDKKVTNEPEDSKNASASDHKEDQQGEPDTVEHPPPTGAARHYGTNDQQSTAPQTRKVTIIGNFQSQWSAQWMIYRKVTSEINKSDINAVVEIIIPSTLVGKVIGKGGSTVKLLQKQTKTTIRLLDDKSSNSTLANGEQNTETLVQITGEYPNFLLAQRQIRTLIRDGLGFMEQNAQANKKAGREPLCS